jgi:lysophospholipase L1-like esterase
MSPTPNRSRVVVPALTLAAWGLVLLAHSFKSTQPWKFGYYWTDFPLLVITVCVALAFTIANFQRGRRFLTAIRVPFLLLAASTIVSLVVLEVSVRVFDPLGISYYSEMSRYILDRVPDAQLKYRHRPSFESTYQGADMRFNEVGLRDDPIGPKPPGEFRILALGDSQTLGWGVARESIWPVRLQQILTDQLHRPVRVINTGCASYETRQEYRYLLSDGYAFQPDMVLLMYMDNDLEITDDPYDPWGDKSFEGKTPGEVLYLLGRSSRVGQLLFYAKWLVPIIIAPQYEPTQFGVRQDFDESMREESGWKASMAALGGIRESVEQHGIKLAVVHFDWTTFPFSRAVREAVSEAVAPFPVAYVPDWFAGQDVRRYCNSVTDAHPNAEGHRILAEHIADFILDQHWIAPGTAEGPRERASSQ